MDWLFREDEYIPDHDKSVHIDRSIFSLLGVLSRIRNLSQRKKNGLYAVSASLKLFFTFMTILFLSLSRSPLYVISIDTAILACISLLDIRDIKRILSLTFAVAFFSAVIMLPSFMSGNMYNSGLLILKICGSVAMLNMMAGTSSINDITGSLRFFFIPGMVILILDLSIKYIVILGEFSMNLLVALKMRSIGKDKGKHTSLSNLAGTLFLKSKEMAEESYHAMQCRGFDGNYNTRKRIKFKGMDALYAFISLALLVLFFII